MYRCVVCKALPVGPVNPMLDPSYGTGYCYDCNDRAIFRRMQSGTALGAAGMAAAASSAAQGVDAAWIAAATSEARRLARSGRPFTIDDITAEVGLPIHRNATGHLLPSLARKGLLVRVGDAVGERPEQHGRRVNVWRGTDKAAAA